MTRNRTLSSPAPKTISIEDMDAIVTPKEAFIYLTQTYEALILTCHDGVQKGKPNGATLRLAKLGDAIIKAHWFPERGIDIHPGRRSFCVV